MKGVEVNNFAKGFVRIRLTDKNGHVMKESKNHNFICDRFKDLTFSQSFNMMFKPNMGTPFGMLYNFKNQELEPYTSSNWWIKYNSLEDGFAVVLLNLTDPVTPWDHTLDMINIFDSSGDLDSSKITGYSVGKRESTVLKEGVLESKTSPDMMAPLNQVVNTFVFDLDKALGSFNYIAIMPNPMLNAYRPLGFNYKLISDYDARTTSTNNFREGYLMPGIKDSNNNVLTPDNTIMTFENINGTNKWFYNILTGEKRAVQPDEAAYNFSDSNISYYKSQQLVVGDYLYILRYNYNALYKYKISDGSYIGVLNLTQASNCYYKGMYYDGTNIIVSGCCTSTSATNVPYIATVNLSNFTASTTLITNYSALGGLPSTWSLNHTFFTKIGSQYIVYCYKIGASIVCTNLANVGGSMIGVCDIVENIYELTDNSIVVISQNTVPAMYIGALVSGGSNISATYQSICVAPFKYSNFWSLFKLDQVYTKTNSQKLFVDYGYAPVYSDSQISNT